jgi:hypothetical protein
VAHDLFGGPEPELLDPIVEFESIEVEDVDAEPAAEVEAAADPDVDALDSEAPNVEAPDSETPDPAADAPYSAMEEFMRSSPVLKASPRPVRRHTPVPATPSPAAASLTALAAEVAHLGVPEGQRAGARAMLLDLARQIDERELEWAGLRESLQLALEYPPLARRVIPLLVPYLDLAA